jgi:hypothetical protein
MKQAAKVTTRFPIDSDLGADNIKRLSDLINEVYDVAESGMWSRKGARTNPAEVERLLRAQALILAEIDGALVDRAENWARDMACHTMRLELLTPRNWTHPSKEFLKKWYFKMGYKPQAPESFEILHPELVPELATECDFTVWYKSLA